MVLPGSALPFKAKVTVLITGSQGDHYYTKAIGCSFIWDSIYHKDSLELFLYGSDLQWALGDMRESVPTPTQRFADLFRTPAPIPHKTSHWSAILYTVTGDDKPLVGLIAVMGDQDTTQRIILFQQHASIRILAQLLSRGSSHLTSYRVGTLKQIDSGVGPLFIGSAVALETLPSAVDVDVHESFEKSALATN